MTEIKESMKTIDVEMYQKIDDILREKGVISKGELIDILNKYIFDDLDCSIPQHYSYYLFGYKFDSVEELFDFLNKEKS